jgi:hypothetical protein
MQTGLDIGIEAAAQRLAAVALSPDPWSSSASRDSGLHRLHHRTRLRGGHDGNRGWLLVDYYRRREARRGGDVEDQGGKGKDGLGRGGGERRRAQGISSRERERK